MVNYVLLCGGLGKRNENYSLPKPLNMIHGKHLIEYVIRDIPSETIYIVYNYILKRYNFEYIVRNLFKKKNFYFYCIDYITRGPVETALVGCNNLDIANEENVMFIDNDNIHGWNDINIDNLDNHFLYYSHDFSDTNRFSFVQLTNDEFVLDIREKERISNNYCCGIYGFQNVSSFKNAAEKLYKKILNKKMNSTFHLSIKIY